MATDATNISDDLQAITNLLNDWAEWMNGYNPNIGYRTRVPMLATGSSTTFEDMLEQTENYAMQSLDASIESLPFLCRAAINRCYGVCAVFRSNRSDRPYHLVLEEAHEMLIVAMKRKGIIV